MTLEKAGDKRASSKPLPFEKALEQLQEAVDVLERGDLTLDKAILTYKVGLEHLHRLKQTLAAAEFEVTQLIEGKEVPLTEYTTDTEKPS